MDDSPYFILLAGVDGIGKTTLYHTAPELFFDSRKIKPSKVIHLPSKESRFKGKRNDNKSSFLQIINESLDSNQSFFIETTLTFAFTAYKEAILNASKHNYKVILYYIDTSDLGIVYARHLADKRIVSFELLKEHYHTSHNQMLDLLAYVDYFIILDNTKHFEIKHMKWK